MSAVLNSKKQMVKPESLKNNAPISRKQQKQIYRALYVESDSELVQSDAIMIQVWK